MKCNEDCFNCTRPANKCKGGSEKTPYSERNTPTTQTVGSGTLGVMLVPTNRWKGKKIYD